MLKSPSLWGQIVYGNPDLLNSKFLPEVHDWRCKISQEAVPILHMGKNIGLMHRRRNEDTEKLKGLKELKHNFGSTLWLLG